MQISSKLFNQQQLKQFSSTTKELQDLQNKIATGENILRCLLYTSDAADE